MHREPVITGSPFLGVKHRERRSPPAPLVLGFLLLFAVNVLAADVPPGFSESVIPGPVAGNWIKPAGATFDATGRMFVWEIGGDVWVKGTAATNFTRLLSLSEEVAQDGDGLLGFALDPDFLANGYLYLLYVVDRHHLLNFGTTNYNATTNAPNQATIGRLTRYTCVASNDFKSVNPASRFVLIGDSKTNGIPICAVSHSVGSLVFGDDGTLLVSTGDSASFYDVDIGGAVNGSYATQALSDGILRTKENVGAYRSQLPDSLNGKILRLDPATGNGIPGNPFFDAAKPKSARSRVWSLGIRNPFRMALRPESGSHDPADANPGALFVGAVGWDDWESLQVVTGPGQNLGWPLFEGLELTPVRAAGVTYNMDVANLDAPNPLYPAGGCSQYFSFRQLLKQDTANAANFPPFNNPCNAGQKIPASIPQFLHHRPALDWDHNEAITRTPVFDGAGNATVVGIGSSGSPVSGTAFRGNCSVGGAWYDGENFPAGYRNKYFHADWGQQIIKLISFDTNNRPVAVSGFASNTGPVVCIVQHPLDGSLYYIPYDGANGTVRRLAYTGNRNPVAMIATDNYFGPGPLTVQFSSAASSDPDGQPLNCVWNFGDGSTISTQPNPSHVFTAAGSAPTNFIVTLTVTDSGGLSAVAQLNIALNDTPPVVTITSPTNGALYSMAGNTPFTLAATVTDAESSDSQLQYLWQSVLHHNGHNHVFATSTNHVSATLLEPVGCDGGNLYYQRVLLTVTDPRGLATVREVKLFPNCGTTDTPPAISDIADQVTTLNLATAPILFTVGDAQVLAANLELSAASSNPSLVPENNIVFGGSGSNRTVTVTPASSSNGTALITVTVSDGPNDVSETFVLTVTGSNTPPTISSLANQTTPEGTATVTNSFIVSDAHTPAGILVLSSASSNPTLVPENNIVFGGTSSNRTVTVTPAIAQTGAATITVTVSDGQLTASNSFVVTVTSLPTGTKSFTNATAIVIADQSPGSPYPSVINVAGLGGIASSVTVTLRSFNHAWGRDVDVLLVGPGGQKVTLLSDAGTGATAANANFTFADSAAGFLPESGSLSSGTYKPTDFAPADLYPLPAPAGPYATNLSVFAGQLVNGAWSLYVADDGPGDIGNIAAGWSLTVTTITTGPQPPVISDIANQTTLTNTPTAALAFTLADADTPVGSLTLEKDSSNPTLVPTNNIAFGGSGASRTVTVTPAAGQVGTATVSVFVSDGTNIASDTFLLTVVASLPVTQSFTNASAITIPNQGASSPYPSTIAVAGMAGTVSNLTVTLRNFSQTWGSDVDVLLVGPAGQKVVLMSDVGSGPVNNVTLILSDAATTALPASGLVSGTNRPTNLTDASPGGDNFPAPAPAAPYGAALTNFIGTAPNGIWSLYVFDDGPGDLGSFAGGWSLTLTAVEPPYTNTAPTISAISNQATTMNTATAAIPFTIADGQTAASNLVVTSTSSSTNLVPTGQIVCVGYGTSRSMTVTPASNQLGTATITLTVSDGSLTASNSFVLTVNPAPPPVIAITKVEMLDASHVRLTGTGNADATHQIQASTDMQTWQSLGTATANGAGVFEFVETLSANFPARFYRVATP